MARHYRYCRFCHADKADVPISKRGLCTKCAIQRVWQTVPAIIVASAQMRAPEPPMPAPAEPAPRAGGPKGT